MEVFGVTKPAVRPSSLKRFKLWLQYDAPWERIGAAVMVLIFTCLVIGRVAGYVIPTKGAESEKCWTSGGRSDDTFC